MNVDTRKQSFLNAVLGPDGATALIKATERSVALEQALVPRAILAWVQSASVYEGEIPGTGTGNLSFEKSESGFSGHVQVVDQPYRFENVSAFYVAGAVAVALGVEKPDIENVSGLDLERLGKSIDILAKARRAQHELKKGKEGGPGLTAAPMAPTAPTPPTGTAPQQPTATKLPTLPGSAQKAKPVKAALPAKPIKPPKTTTRLTRSEAGHECVSCGQRQFGDDPFVFRGCMCFRALAAGVNVLGISKSEVVLQMDPRVWDPEAMVTFLESVGRGRDDR